MVNELALVALQEGSLEVSGQFTFSSNYTFLAKVDYQGEIIEAVYKPCKGETPLWDFPRYSLAHREVAAYIVCSALHWDFIPPTVFRKSSKAFGKGALQLYVKHDPNYHYFAFSEDDKQRLMPVVLFDLLANNADRKGGHVLVDRQGKLWAIDHGLCFHEQDKLRTVIWDFCGQAIPPNLLEDINRFALRLVNDNSLVDLLEQHITRNEIEAMLSRIQRLKVERIFPCPPQDRRAYPWPPV